MKTSIRLSLWAKQNGLTYTGAYNLYRNGGIPGAFKLESGTILIPDSNITNKPPSTIIYARVSSTKQKADLERQVQYTSEFCIANGWVITKIYKEIASGLNDNRTQLNKIFNDKDITRVVISEKDRLTRFGFNYIKKLLELKGIELVVINISQTDQDDLIRDFVSVITSMAARVYGLRRHRSHVEKIINEIKNHH